MTHNNESMLLARVQRLERDLARTRLTVWLAGASLAVVCACGMGRDPERNAGPLGEVIARKVSIVDDAGVTRLVLGQDPKDTQRRSRAAGLTLYDKHGDERGGLITFDDDGVVLALDAPRGVGSAMRDRLGLTVGADGSVDVSLIDNMTRAVAKLVSFGDGKGGVQLLRWDMQAKRVHVKTLTFSGEERFEKDIEQ